MSRFAHKVSVPILLLSLLLAACAPPAVSSTPTSTPRFSEADVNHMVALDKMEGYLRVSLLLWEAGNYDLAATHASLPMAELFSLVEADLKAKQAAAPLREALDAYAALAGQAGEAAKVKAAQQAALDAVHTAAQALAGSLTDDLAFQSEVIHGLLQGVEEEYGEALSNGQIAEVVKYQEGLGFFLMARARYESIAATIQAAHPNEHTKIEEYFSELAKALPEVTPPTPAADFKEVEGDVDGIVAELNEALGLQTQAAESPVEIIAGIREKIADALKEYREGKNDAAYELAADAYLDGFEHIEADMTAKGAGDLMTTLETQFKDLRDGIKAGKPQADIEQLASEINANLDKAEALFK
jgi:hypothetical protein